MKKVLAFDFGASSGRAMLGTFDGEKISLQEIHRFSNDPVEVCGNLHWDILRLFYEIKQGILKCVHSGNKDISAIGIDTWGVDYGLFNSENNLIGNPFHYRDIRTDGMIEKACEIAGREFIFDQTGVQIIWFNTAYQLLSMTLKNSSSLNDVKTLLLTPDMLNYFLTGVQTTERTIASTTQLYNPSTKTWAYDLMEKLNIPKKIFTPIVDAGTVIGSITPELSDELDIVSVPVIAVASHDTASAVVSVPIVDEEDYIYISSGTWSLMGIESDTPIINEKSYQHNFTNELGYNGKVRFLKNIMGLWIVQECKRQWEREGDNVSFAELEVAALDATPFENYINPDDTLFATPGNMPRRIKEFCEKTNQKVPQTKGEILRCVYQSIALKYRYTVECLEDILGKELKVIHIVGGGIKDKTLCKLTAYATNKKVVAGPVEATAIGNIAVQLISLGEIENITQARKIIANSFEATTYMPEDSSVWDDAYEKYKKII